MDALVDCTNFFASYERVFRPDLNGKLVVILSNNDGCVIVRSNVVKALGIPLGAQAFKFKKVFDTHQVHVFSTIFFCKDLPQYRKNSVIKTEQPTHSSRDLIRYGIMGLRAIFKEGYQYKKAGVIVSDLTPENERQLNLYYQENSK